MADETLLTLRQMAEELSLPESTVRYYRDAFLDHIPSVGTGRRRRYPREAVAALRAIAESYASGRSRPEIAAGMASRGGASASAITVASPKHASRPMDEVSNLDLLAAILDGEREQRDALWQMASEIVRLTEVLEGQDRILVEVADRAGVVVAPRAVPQSRPAAAIAASPAAEPAPTPLPEPVPAPQPVPVMEAQTQQPVSDATMAAPAGPPSFIPPVSVPPSPMTPVAAAVPVPFAPPVQPSAEPTAASDLEKLRSELEAERALVERLREAKLKLEHRASDAEAALTEGRGKRASVFSKLLGGQSS